MSTKNINVNESEQASKDAIVLGREFYFLLNEEDDIYDELYGEELGTRTSESENRRRISRDS